MKGILITLLATAAVADAQIATDVLEKYRPELARQTTDPDQKREGGTQPRDWEYRLAEGIRTRQVTFYVDGGTPLYGKLFLPKGFSTSGRFPAVVVGHGVNALSIGIEKFAARFAERGLVAMAIDYQSYGFSGSGSDDIRLLEPDLTTDESAVTGKEARIVLKRTNLNNVHEVADFRAAVSFLQGEPGIDANRMFGAGVAGAHVVALAANDARVQVAVAHAAIPLGKGNERLSFAPSAAQQASMIKLARTGQAPSTAAAAAAMNDEEMRLAVAEYQPFRLVDQIPATAQILHTDNGKDARAAAAEWFAKHLAAATTTRQAAP